MKKYISLLAVIVFVCFSNAFAQQGQKLTYKTTVKNKDGAIVPNSNVVIKISIIEGSATGNEVYSEMHNARTDEQGQVALEVGKGNMTSGSLKNVNWNAENFIRTEAQPMGTIKVSKLRRTLTSPDNKSMPAYAHTKKPITINTDSLRQIVEARKAAALIKADSLKKANDLKAASEQAKVDSIKKFNELKRKIELAKADSVRKIIEAKRLTELAKADSAKKALDAIKARELAKADSIKKVNEIKRKAELAKADSVKKIAEKQRLIELAKTDSIKKSLETKKAKELAKADSLKRIAMTKTPPPILKIDTVAKKPTSAKTVNTIKTPNADSIKQVNEAKRMAALAKADSVKKLLEYKRLQAQKKADSLQKATLLKKSAPPTKVTAEENDFKVVLKVDTAKALELKKQIETLKRDSSANHTTTLTDKKQRKKTEASVASQPVTVATQVSIKQTVGFETLIKNINGAPFANAPVIVKTSVLKDSAKGNVVFSEEHAAITDYNGIAKLNIGGGTPIGGDFKNIDWANGKYFIKTEANPTGVTKIDRINYSHALLPQSDTIDKKQYSAIKKAISEQLDTTANSLTKYGEKPKNISSNEDKNIANSGIEDDIEFNEEKIASSSANKLKWDEYRVKLYLYNESINKNPSNADAYAQRGLIKNELEDYRGAIADFTKALSIDSSKVDVYNSRGLAKINANNYKGAMDDFNKSLSMNKQQANTYALMGVANAYLKNFKEALTNLDSAIMLDKDSAKYYSYRGTCKYNMNDLRGALDDYNSAIGLNPNDYLMYFNRANTKAQMRDQIDAIDDYNKTIGLAPSFAKAYYKRGNAKADLKDVRGAIIDYEKSISIDPDYAKAYYNAGVMKAKLKEFESAIVFFDKAIELAQDWGSAYFNRGISKISIDIINEGCLDLSIAGEKGYTKAYDVIKRKCAK